MLKKPICPWNNQNWQIKEGKLTLPVSWDSKVQRIEIACAQMELVGMAGLLRIKKKRGKWIADVTMTQAKPAPVIFAILTQLFNPEPLVITATRVQPRYL